MLQDATPAAATIESGRKYHRTERSRRASRTRQQPAGCARRPPRRRGRPGARNQRGRFIQRAAESKELKQRWDERWSDPVGHCFAVAVGQEQSHSLELTQRMKNLDFWDSTSSGDLRCGTGHIHQMAHHSQAIRIAECAEKLGTGEEFVPRARKKVLCDLEQRPRVERNPTAADVGRLEQSLTDGGAGSMPRDQT